MPQTKKRTNYAMLKSVGDDIAVIDRAQDEEVERLAISVFYKAGSKAIDPYLNLMTQNYFVTPAYRTAFLTMVKMRGDGLDIDEGMFETYFLTMPCAEPRKQLDEVLFSLDPKVKLGNLERYVGVLAKKFTARQLQAMIFEVWQKLSNGRCDPDSTVLEIRSKLDECTAGSIMRVGTPMSETIDAHIAKLRELAKQEEDCTGVETGIYELDKLTFGWQKGDLIIIGGASSMGKTAMALGSLWHAVKTYPKEFFFLSTQEMSTEQVENRIISIETGIDLQRLIAPKYLGEEQWKLVERAREKIKDSHLIIEDRVMPPEEVTGQWLRALSKFGAIKMFLLDYVQFSARMDSPRFGNDERLAIVNGVTNLKAFAKRDGGIAPVIALSQITRAAVDRIANDPKQRPRKEDFDGSSTIEKDCDVAILVHRPYQYFKDENPHAAEIIVDKQRNGPPAVIHVDWLERSATFKGKRVAPKQVKLSDTWDDLD